MIHSWNPRQKSKSSHGCRAMARIRCPAQFSKRSAANQKNTWQLLDHPLPAPLPRSKITPITKMAAAIAVPNYRARHLPRAEFESRPDRPVKTGQRKDFDSWRSNAADNQMNGYSVMNMVTALISEDWRPLWPHSNDPNDGPKAFGNPDTARPEIRANCNALTRRDSAPKPDP